MENEELNRTCTCDACKSEKFICDKWAKTRAKSQPISLDGVEGINLDGRILTESEWWVEFKCRTSGMIFEFKKSDILCKAAHQVKEIWEDVLPKKFNGADLCAVREDFGWWAGYDCKDLEQEISATGRTLDEAFNKLNDYWFKSGKCKESERKRK